MGCDKHRKRTCSKQKYCPAVNIYHFGDSQTDPGNFAYEPCPGPEKTVSVDTPIPPYTTIQFRVNPEKRNSDGKNWPFFVADNLKLELLKGSAIDRIPKKKGKYVNFAFTGASQNLNNNLLPPNPCPLPTPDFGSFQYQIQKFQNLLNTSHKSVKENDIFVYHDVGGNDALILLLTLLQTPPEDWPATIAAYATTYVTSTLNNLTTLYGLGMRRLFLVLASVDLIYPATLKFALVVGQGDEAAGLAILAPVFAALQTALNTALDAFLPSLVGLETVRLETKPFYDALVDNAATNGTSLPAIRFDQNNYNTQAGLGFPGNSAWPLNAPLPVRNVHNLVFIDDLHYTQHSNYIIA